MSTQFLLSLSWLWQDLTKSSHQICFSLAVLLVFLWLILRRYLTESLWSTLFEAVLLLCISGFEIVGVTIYHRGDPTWFLSSLGNFFFGLGVAFVALITILGQFTGSMRILDDIGYYGDFDNHYGEGYISIVVALVVALAVSFFAKDYINWVAIAFIVFQIYIFVRMLVSAIRNDGNVFLMLFSYIVYVINFVGMVLFSVNFIAIAIFLGILMLMGRGHTQCCANCKSYGDGYCYYRNKYVNSSSSCNKFIED